MKRDPDLVRDILLQIEASPGDPRRWVVLDFPDRSGDDVAYHVQMLAEEGFLHATDVTSMGPGGYDWRPKQMTYQGHELLDTIRDPAIWRQTKEEGRKLGSTSIQFLFEIGKAILKQKLVEHGVHLP